MDHEAIENKEISVPELDEAAAFLGAQLVACHAASGRCFEMSRGAGGSYEWQLKAMQTATRLMQASATAASALKRLKGSESRHTVRVEQGGRPHPQKIENK
jgi:hypothetical protein